MNLLRCILCILVLLVPMTALANGGPPAPTGGEAASPPSYPSDPDGCNHAQGYTGSGSMMDRYNSGMGITSGNLGVDWYKERYRIKICPCSPGLWIERTVHCFTSVPDGVIYKAVNNFIDGARPYYESIFGAAILAAVVIFGFRLMAGTVKMIPRESFILIFKIIGVSMFLLNYKDIYELLIHTTYNLGNMIAKMTSGFGDICGTGEVSVVDSVPTLWAQFDCVFHNLLGIRSGALIAGIMAMVLALVFSGGMLAGAAIGIIYILLTLITAAMRMVFVYVASIISISFLMLLGPIFVPLVLFSSRVDQFKKWAIMTVMHMFVPMLLYIVMVIVLVMLQYSIFVGPTSLFYMFSGKVPQEAVDFQSVVAPGSAYKYEDVGIVHTKLDASTYSSNPSASNTTYTQGQVLPSATTAVSSESVIEQNAKVFTLNKQTVASNAGKTVYQWSKDLLSGVLGALIVAYISYTLLSSAPQIVNKLVAQGVNGQYVTQGQMLGQGGMEKGAAALNEMHNKSKRARGERNALEGRTGLSKFAPLSGGQRGDIARGIIKQMINAETGGVGGAAMDAAEKAGKASKGASRGKAGAGSKSQSGSKNQSGSKGGSNGKDQNEKVVGNATKDSGIKAGAGGGTDSGADSDKSNKKDAIKTAINIETGGAGTVAEQVAGKAADKAMEGNKGNKGNKGNN